MKNKDEDFDEIIEIMKNEFQWKGEVNEDNFDYTNELIKAVKIKLNPNGNMPTIT